MSASAPLSSSPQAAPLSAVGPLVAPRVRGAASALVVVGLIGFVALLATDINRAWHAWLIGLVIPAFLSVAATAFLAVHRLCNARWTAPLKRLAEGLGAGLPLTLVAFIVFAVFGLPYVYEWAWLAVHAPAEHLALLHSPSKAAWLSPQRVITTTTVILMVWIALRGRLISLSLAEDAGVDNRPAQVRWSVIFLLVMAYTFSLFAWDLLLSLNVHTVSAMWGIYEFVGAVQAFLGILSIVLVWMSRGQLGGVIREHTIKDVGTWLLAWSCVWAYITFAQYIIIAFANMDEETQWFLMRQQNGYQYPFFVECLLRLPLPFFLLLSQHTRTKPVALIAAGAAVVLGFVIELIWQVLPALFPNHVPNFLALPELAVALGFLGGYLLLALLFWQRHGTVARGDRDLLPAINAQHLH
jgi:preprotein translocase subunit Sss1